MIHIKNLNFFHEIKNDIRVKLKHAIVLFYSSVIVIFNLSIGNVWLNTIDVTCILQMSFMIFYSAIVIFTYLVTSFKILQTKQVKQNNPYVKKENSTVTRSTVSLM